MSNNSQSWESKVLYSITDLTGSDKFVHADVSAVVQGGEVGILLELR